MKPCNSPLYPPLPYAHPLLACEACSGSGGIPSHKNHIPFKGCLCTHLGPLTPSPWGARDLEALCVCGWGSVAVGGSCCCGGGRGLLLWGRKRTVMALTHSHSVSFPFWELVQLLPFGDSVSYLQNWAGEPQVWANLIEHRTKWSPLSLG